MVDTNKLTDGAIKEHRSVRCDYIHIQPGDGTKYELLIADWDDEVMVSGTLCKAYWLRKNSIKSAYPCVIGEEEVSTWERKQIGQSEALDTNLEPALQHHYVWYVAEMGHCDCNPWTARAIIIACYIVIKKWEEMEL